MFFPFSSVSKMPFSHLQYRLKPLDIEVMKRLGTRVNLIPVVAKADTLTQTDLATFKHRVRLFASGSERRKYSSLIIPL